MRENLGDPPHRAALFQRLIRLREQMREWLGRQAPDTKVLHSASSSSFTEDTWADEAPNDTPISDRRAVIASEAKQSSV
jgi:hypothetical protein